MNKIEKHKPSQLEIKFYKKILQVNKTTATTGVRGELGRHPILLEALANSVKYKTSLATKPSNSLVREALTELSNLKASSEWLPTVNTLATQLQVRSPNVLNKNHIKKFGNKILHSLKTEYEDHWHRDLNRELSSQKNKGGNKLRSYRKIKQNFHMEPYLQNIDNITHRKNLTQLRLSSHKLNIETMRATTPDPNLRICNKCALNEKEDEEHFLLRCQAYAKLRIDFISSITQSNPNTLPYGDTHWFIYLLTNEDKTVCKALGKYITACLKIN